MKKSVLVIAMLLMVLAFAGGALAYVPYNNIWGTQYSETLYGTGGNDYIYTERGEDTVYAGEGDDYISTRDGADPYGGTGGADLIYCGPGFDSVDADLSDVLAEDCEPPTLTAAVGVLENPGTTAEGFGDPTPLPTRRQASTTCWRPTSSMASLARGSSPTVG